MMMRYILLAILCIFPSQSSAKLPPAAKKKIVFQRDIQPILKRHCINCHGPKRQRGGLRLDSRAEALKGSNTGSVLKPGDAQHSRLLIVTAGLDDEVKMPPESREPLTNEQLGLLRAWIDQGLHWPKDDTQVVEIPKSDHWAFQTPRRPALPKVYDGQWPRNPIDHFILAKLEKEGITPSREADRTTLIRRLTLDLLGLPPTPEEVDQFINDPRPDAYERLVERLFSSPHYGERWARHWLDAARYADSDGYEKDRGRPYAWRWRNQLIEALNRNQPYDQFVIEQLAGDLLPNATLQQKMATGFHRNTLTNTEGGVDKEQFRVEAVIDRVNTTSTVFLGITMACAQCHDHKYDPFSQREYYQFFAFFNSDQEVNLPTPEKGVKYDKKKKPPYARTLKMGATRKTHVHIRGDFLRKGIEVKPGVPAVLGALASKSPKPMSTRLDLAKWIVSDDNPLTARVLVNQLWHRFFGRGFVTTMDDFGTRAGLPSHPQLLDWLATEAIRQQWSVKSLQRLIVTSTTYRQSSKIRPELLQRDPLNILVSRQKRMRLDAEIIRDCALASSGLLTTRIGGPSVRPPQPKGVSNLTYANSAKWVESKDENRYRRGLYIWFQRTSPYPMLTTFDAPDSNVCCVKRERSCTPLQALTLLNDRVFVECARELAKRTLKDENRIDRAFRLCLGREPTVREKERLSLLFEELLQLCQENPQAVLKLTGEKKPTEQTIELAAWTALARTLLNLDETVTRE